MRLPPGSPSTAASQPDRRQFRSIDLFKIIAVQLIVLHHLAFYGPMSDRVELIAPSLIGWLNQYGRMAVQVFLVSGGFLAARSLSPRGTPGIARPWHALWRRYLKLAPPFMVATMLTIAASALASQWMTHSSISATPTLAQLAAHALLLHGVLGIASVSAGAWYVAIDFQLYALMTLLLWLSGSLARQRQAPWLMPTLVTLLASASLLLVNRDPSWDNWALYFFGSYGLGALAWWICDRDRSPAAASLLGLAILLPAVIALLLDFRSRIAVALALACLLIICNRRRVPLSSPNAARVGWIDASGRISYAVFLIHFPVCLLVNAFFTRFVAPEPMLQAIGMLLAWSASLLVGAVFHHWVEVPLGRLFQHLGHGASPATRLVRQ